MLQEGPEALKMGMLPLEKLLVSLSVMYRRQNPGALRSDPANREESSFHEEQLGRLAADWAGRTHPAALGWAGFAFPGSPKLWCLLAVIHLGSGFDFCTLQQSQPRIYFVLELASVSAETSGLQQITADSFKD